jgi:molybdopterin-guanine dinucleotide biosynthesis protein B
MSRLSGAFQNGAAFIGFVTGGDPTLAKSEEFILEMARAGADVVAIASATHAAVMENRPVHFAALVDAIHDVDVILTEGYKTGDYPKIALRRGERDFAVAPAGCLAVMSDTPVDALVPSLALDDVTGLADIISREIVKK